MATIKSFKAVRPQPEYAGQVAALPYDVMSSEEAREMGRGNPYSFLHIDKAEIDLPKETDLYAPAVYQKAKENFEKMLQEGIFIQDESECLYIYELTMAGRVSTGLVACTSIDEYLDGTIKKHELTREEKEQDRIRHVDTLNANTGPIFLAYRAEEACRTILQNWKQSHSPIYDFTAENSIIHRAWIIQDPDAIQELVACFEQISSLYIADGHHRNASAVKVGLKRREENPQFSGKEEFNYYLSVLFPHDELYIMDYNRLVADLNGLSKEDFFNKLENIVSIEQSAGNTPVKPGKKGDFGMYLEGCWYLLSIKPQCLTGNTLSDLDISLLQNHILAPILGIQDVRSDKRIDFAGGIRGLNELSKRVDSGEMTVAFAMFPTSMEELMSIADQQEMMPPKSTWFEPKLRSGLFIHLLS